MLKTLIVVDTDETSGFDSSLELLSFSDYLKDYPKLNESKVRVINLCDVSRYLSQGYYCSLLAEARQHHVLPNVKVINTLRQLSVSNEIDFAFEPTVSFNLQEEQQHIVCFGEVEDEQWKKLAAKLFVQYPAPVLQVTLLPVAEKIIHVKLQCIGFNELDKKSKPFFFQSLVKYANVNWRKQEKSKDYRWDMAILVNPNEDAPPSDKGALQRFIRAAEKLGIRAQTVTADQLFNINQYDALFIRETTAIDHPTYKLARKAEANGLVVLDDPDSILRCCNKVFLHDAFNYKKIPSLKTHVIDGASDEILDKLESNFTYPIILKMPEGSFSRGVYKVNDRKELSQHLTLLLEQSALVLAQEYCFTEYDWRIGVLNGQALFACRYYMARNHWQIYNHKSKKFFSGGFDALPTFEVPKKVLGAALKAASVVGNGFYGVDIKFTNDKAYVIEVNDNPSIDHGVEDKYLGEELYMQVMSEFLRRLEMRGR